MAPIMVQVSTKNLVVRTKPLSLSFGRKISLTIFLEIMPDRASKAESAQLIIAARQAPKKNTVRYGGKMVLNNIGKISSGSAFICSPGTMPISMSIDAA